MCEWVFVLKKTSHILFVFSICVFVCGGVFVLLLLREAECLLLLLWNVKAVSKKEWVNQNAFMNCIVRAIRKEGHSGTHTQTSNEQERERVDESNAIYGRDYLRKFRIKNLIKINK